MATRRQMVGQSIADSGKSLMDMYVQNMLREQEANSNDVRLRARTAESQKNAMELAQQQKELDYTRQHQLDADTFLKGRVEKDPSILTDMGKTEFMGIPTSALLPSQDEIAGPLFKDIDSATSLANQRTPEGIRGQFVGAHGNPTVKLPEGGEPSAPLVDVISPQMSALYNALKAKGSSLTSAFEQTTPPTKVETPTGQFGQKTQQFYPPNKLAGLGPLPAEPSPEQSAAAFNATDAAERKAKAATAGAISGAQTMAGLTPDAIAGKARLAGATKTAELSSEYLDPKITLSKIEEMKQKGIQEAATAGMRENAVEANKAANSSSSAVLALDQLRQGYNAVKLGPGAGNDLRRTGRAMAHALPGAMGDAMVDPRVAILDRQADEYKMLLYRAFGGTGQGVSDTDLKFLSAGVPTSSTLASIGDQVYKNSTIALTYHPMIIARYGNTPFETQRDVVTAWAKANEEALAKSKQLGIDITSFDDPFSPGKKVPVIK